MVAGPRVTGEGGRAAAAAAAPVPAAGPSRPRAPLLRRLLRMLRHLFSTRAVTRRLFTPALLTEIEQACAAAEAHHLGELRFAVETALPPAAIWHGITPRERALAVFAQLHIWDTQDNNGVLIYVLRADRAVEIIADRGISAHVSVAEWQHICREVQTQYRAGRFADGSKAAIAGVAALLARHFPAPRAAPTDELPNQPILL